MCSIMLSTQQRSAENMKNKEWFWYDQQSLMDMVCLKNLKQLYTAFTRKTHLE